MSIAKRDEGKKVNSNINVTPMVDVMLVLLIIFMVITPMLNNKVNVTLPTEAAAVVMDNAPTRSRRQRISAHGFRISWRTRRTRKCICGPTTVPCTDG